MDDDEQAADGSKPADPERDAKILEAYRELAELTRAAPEEGQEAVEARLALYSAFGRLAELEESAGRNSLGLAAREAATKMVRQVKHVAGDHIVFRLMEASQLNSRGFTLREMENWTDALAIYTELAELMDDGADGSSMALYLTACAQDGIGDIHDTLGDAEARDAAWERARILFQSCIHATKNEAGEEFSINPPQVLLDDVIAKQQEVS